MQTEDRTKTPVEALDGSTITVEKAKLVRWREHFQQLLNRYDPPTLADISEAEQDFDIELAPVTFQEVKDAIKKPMNDKSPEDKNVYAEMLIAEEQEIPQLLQTHPPGRLGQCSDTRRLDDGYNHQAPKERESV